MRMVAALILSAWALAGCASPTSPQFSVPAGQYARAFEETRDLLRSYRFSLDRVDAAAGVITTSPKTSAGLATPWDREQTSVAQEFQDLLNQQSRRVRVTFRPAASGEDEHPLNGAIDPGEALVGRFEVIIYRMQTPVLRSPSRAILLSTVATDPALTEEGIYGQYAVPVAQDSRLAARLASQVERRLGPIPVTDAGQGRAPQRLARP